MDDQIDQIDQSHLFHDSVSLHLLTLPAVRVRCNNNNVISIQSLYWRSRAQAAFFLFMPLVPSEVLLFFFLISIERYPPLASAYLCCTVFPASPKLRVPFGVKPQPSAWRSRLIALGSESRKRRESHTTHQTHQPARNMGNGDPAVAYAHTSKHDRFIVTMMMMMQH